MSTVNPHRIIGQLISAQLLILILPFLSSFLVIFYDLLRYSYRILYFDWQTYDLPYIVSSFSVRNTYADEEWWGCLEQWNIY